MVQACSIELRWGAGVDGSYGTFAMACAFARQRKSYSHWFVLPGTCSKRTII